MSVLLIFPPIVTSGFGSYYPSLAVLAGHLKSNGIVAHQHDLNQELARSFLAEDALAAIGRGYLPGAISTVDLANMASVAARLLRKNLSYVADDNGRLPPADNGAGAGYLLPLICKSLQIDEPLNSVLDRVKSRCPVTAWYRQFYAASSIHRLLSEHNPELLGISIPMGPQLLPAITLCQHIKEINPEIKIILGGAAISLMREVDLELILSNFPYVDAAVRYEGEDALLSLARQVQAKVWRPMEVHNVSSISENGIVCHCAPKAAMDLDKLAFANYSQSILAGLQEPEISIVQTRGCYWGRCAYCDFVELYEGSPRYRSRSPDSFVGEIEHHIATHKIFRFSLITEAIPPSFARKFSRLLIERNIRIKWNSFAMVDQHFTDEHFALMKASGCESLVIGLETMTDRVLSLVGKYASSESNIKFLRDAKAAGIILKVNLIPNLPTTTYSEALESLRILEGLSEFIDTVAVFPFEATRSSQIGRNPAKYGLIPTLNVSTSGQALFAANHLSVTDLGMSNGELEEVLIRYKQYADKINSREFSRGCELSLSGNTNRGFKVAINDFDLIPEAEHLLVFNWRAREQWRIPKLAGKIISAIVSQGEYISPQDLHNTIVKFPETLDYFQGLIYAGILVSADQN